MPESVNTIECPKCGTTIDVSSALAERLRREHEASLAEERKGIEERQNQLDAQEAAFESRLQEQLQGQLEIQRADLKKELAAEHEDEFKVLAKELKEKSNKVKEFNKLNAEKLRLERTMDEMKDEFEAKAQERINEEVGKAKREAKKTAQDDSELKQKTLIKTIDDLKSDLKDAQRRADQGSVQLQGEVQELAIEEWLAREFPLDTIEEIKKGAQGADCIQHVNTRQRTGCGTIYYESKRTRGFQATWIPKLKDDMRTRGADIAVLVTQAMPSGMERIGLVDGVWVCSFPEFKGISKVLREAIVHLDTARETSRNKGEKMGMLYDYLTGSEFRLQIEAIVEGFTYMHADLESEKRSMRRIWKKREKQIERVLMSTADMYGAIQGIAGTKALPTFESLALPEPRAENGESEEDG